MKATRVHCTTLLGIGGPFPRKGGNCFSVETEEGPTYHIINFRLENFEELIRRGIAHWPIEIEPIDKHHAKVVDERMPIEWYDERHCSICYRA